MVDVAGDVDLVAHRPVQVQIVHEMVLGANPNLVGIVNVRPEVKDVLVKVLSCHCFHVMFKIGEKKTGIDHRKVATHSRAAHLVQVATIELEVVVVQHQGSKGYNELFFGIGELSSNHSPKGYKTFFGGNTWIKRLHIEGEEDGVGRYLELGVKVQESHFC